MYVCIYIYVCVCVYTYIYTYYCIYIHIIIYMHTYICVCVYARFKASTNLTVSYNVQSHFGLIILYLSRSTAVHSTRPGVRTCATGKSVAGGVSLSVSCMVHIFTLYAVQTVAPYNPLHLDHAQVHEPARDQPDAVALRCLHLPERQLRRE